jgi:hypothetical protein
MRLAFGVDALSVSLREKPATYWFLGGFVHLFAFGKKLNLVAGGGIEPPTRGFSN